MDKPEAYGVTWFDLMLGISLCLPCPDATAAKAQRDSIRNRGVGKVDHVQAVRVPAGMDAIEVLP